MNMLLFQLYTSFRMHILNPYACLKSTLIIYNLTVLHYYSIGLILPRPSHTQGVRLPDMRKHRMTSYTLFNIHTSGPVTSLIRIRCLKYLIVHLVK
jgi:hypothetical protein